MVGVVPPDDAMFPVPPTLVTPVAPAALIVRLGAAPVMEIFAPAVNAVRGVVTSALFGTVAAVKFKPLIDGAAASVMFGVAPPDDAILPVPVTLVTPAAAPAAEMVIFGADPVSVIFAPAVNAVKGVVTSALFGMLLAAMFAPLMVGGIEKNVAARFVVPTTVSPEFACNTAPLMFNPAGNE